MILVTKYPNYLGKFFEFASEEIFAFALYILDYHRPVHWQAPQFGQNKYKASIFWEAVCCSEILPPNHRTVHYRKPMWTFSAMKILRIILVRIVGNTVPRNNFYSCSFLLFLTAATCFGLYLTIFRRNIQFRLLDFQQSWLYTQQDAESKNKSHFSNLYGKKVSYLCNRPWRPIGLSDVAYPTFPRQSTHRYAGEVFCLKRRPRFTPKKIPSTHFC
jgi:hypothetical protein